MKIPLLAVLFSILVSPRVFAESASYEAQIGLIPIGGFVIFYNSQGPLSYDTLTPKEIPRDADDIGEVKCEICQQGVSIPILSSSGSRSTSISAARGDGGFGKALLSFRKEKPELRGIYDVKIDFHRISILGIYRRLCTEVTARGFK